MEKIVTNISRALIAFALIASTPALATGDATKGKEVFNRCAICHSNTKGAPNKIGPNLFGVVGRKAGTEPGFSYSAAVKSSGVTWSEANLDKWLTSPGRFIPGNRMPFAGLPSADQRADVIAYLKTLK